MKTLVFLGIAYKLHIEMKDGEYIIAYCKREKVK